MATNDQPSNGVLGFSESQAHLALRESQASSQPSGPRAFGGRGRRRSSAFVRAEHNVENFVYNRRRGDTAVRFGHRARTRSVARIETEQQEQQREQQQRLLQEQQERQQEQEQQQQQQQQQQQTAPEASGVQSTINPHQNGSVEEWKPSIVIGSPLWAEGEDLNAIQIADRKVIQTRLWVDHYQGVPYFVQTHQKAVEERAQLDESAEDNTMPRSMLKSTHNDAIHDRLDVLRFLLQDSTFPGERTNIEAAIAGYESGAIPYSDAYTLLWAGHIVDRCPDFDSFTHDRSARLDRYEATHGPGWLWYEPPLTSSATGSMRGPTVIAKKGFCLESKQAWRQGTENMGHYNIRMGFRRRKNTVTRDPKQQQQRQQQQPTLPNTNTNTRTNTNTNTRTTNTRTTNTTNTRTTNTTNTRTNTRTTTPTTRRPPKPKPTIPQPDTSRPHTTTPDPDGPQLIYNMLLDSGATLPTLWTGDLPALGIDPARYSAQSARRVNTADSVLVSRVYELDVRVLGGEEAAPVGLFVRRRRGGEVVEEKGVGVVAPVLRSGGVGVVGGAGGGIGGGGGSRVGMAAASVAVVDAGAGDGKGEDDEEDDEFDAPNCTIPVLVFPGNSKAAGPGDHVPDRLSGLLPFHLCYFSGAPGTFKLWMGEDRRDVLGAGRLPGMMRYGEILNGPQTGDKSKKVPAWTTSKLAQWRNQGLRTPERVIFEHGLTDDAEGVLRDEDVGDGNAIMRGPRGTDFDNIDTQADGVQVLHIGRKRKRVYQEARRPGSTVTKPAKKKIKSEQTGERTV